MNIHEAMIHLHVGKMLVYSGHLDMCCLYKGMGEPPKSEKRSLLWAVQYLRWLVLEELEGRKQEPTRVCSKHSHLLPIPTA